MTVFELVAKLTLDSSEYESDLKKQSEGGGKLAGAWGKIGKAVGIGAAAIGAASAAVGVLTKKSVSAYAEFEQLAGGVKKLYGDAADELMGYANDAYRTAGMSANQYMEQATSFSAALRRKRQSRPMLLCVLFRITSTPSVAIFRTYRTRFRASQNKTTR